MSNPTKTSERKLIPLDWSYVPDISVPDTRSEIEAVTVYPSDRQDLFDWAPNLPALLPRNRRAEEWYFECALCGFHTLSNVVEIDVKRRGGLPVLRGTGFTVSQVLAELSDTTAIDELADNFDLDETQLRDLLQGLALILQRPYLK
jgi:uncharacterized protein (DUF433 family)